MGAGKTDPPTTRIRSMPTPSFSILRTVQVPLGIAKATEAA